MTVTKEQALAFVEALTGYTSTNKDGDDSGEAKSQHALTHLEAVLGQTNVANYFTASRAMTKDWKPGAFADDRNKLNTFIVYLEAVTTALREAMPQNYPAQTDPKEF